jgi:predicted lipopolysaccharide heptosyltransferase III
VDALGYMLWAPAEILRKDSPPQKEEIKEILVLRTAYIGDVIMTLPILKPLRNLYPDARISFLTTSKTKGILENNPYINEVLEYDAFWFYKTEFKKAFRDYIKFLKILRTKKYDLIIETRADIRDIFLLAYLCKSKYRVSYNVGGGGYLLTHIVLFKEIKHKVQYHLDIARYLGAQSCDNIEWDISITQQERESFATLLFNEGVNPLDLLIGIHPGGRKELKCWLKQGFAEVADRLISEHGAKIIFTGSQQEKKLIDDIISMMRHDSVNLAGKINIRGLCAAIQRFGIFICNDSAPLHIASVLKTPTVAVFGPSKSNETGPFGNVHRVVEKNFPCRYTCDEDVCKHKVYNECMKTITPDDVYEAANSILKQLHSGREILYSKS